MKIINRLFLLVLCFLVFTFTSSGISFSRDTQEGIPLSQVPKRVIRAAKRAVFGIRLLDAKVITKEDGQISYLLDGAVGQEEFAVEVDAEGNILSDSLAKEIKNDVPLSRVPNSIISTPVIIGPGYKGVNLL